MFPPMKKASQRLFIFCFVAPAFFILIGVVVYPFLYNVVLSFSNMNLRHLKDWELVGMRQYIKVFTEPTQPNF